MHILGNDVAKFGRLRVWAERGLVHVEDSRDNSYEAMPVRTMLHRIKAINDMLGNTRAGRKGFVDEQMRQDLQAFVEAAADVCRKAQIQGMPDDPSARRDAVRRQSRTVFFPAAAANF